MPIRSVSFKVTILVVFAVVTFAISGLVIYVNYVRSTEAILMAAGRLLEEVGGNISNRAQLLLDPPYELVETSILIPGIDTEPQLLPHPATPILLAALDRHSEITSMYVGQQTGDFFQAFSLRGARSAGRQSLQAPPDAEYAIRNIIRRADGKRITFWRFLDANREMLGSRVEADTTYDPRGRPWYQAAMATAEPIVTDFYPFASLPSLGLTIAQRFEGDRAGVFGVDLSLASISDYLHNQQLTELRGVASGRIAIFGPDDHLLAYSDRALHRSLMNRSSTPRIPTIEETGDRVLSALVNQHKTSQARSIRVDVENDTWLAHVAPMPDSFGKRASLVIAVPFSEFLGPLAASAWRAMLASIAAVLLCLPLVYVVASGVSTPLKRLTQEVQQLRRLEISNTTPMRSTISEIQNLANALATSKFMLGVFGKYVPKNLVQQIVDTGVEPVLGGERREVTVFFSDIRDFTTLSEQLAPEQLMELTSEYLEGLVKLILQHRGTVDKFVGDEVMAYWNAPALNPNHALDGCLTVLRCRDWVAGLNARRARSDTPVMYTRFAIHSGDAVVGNVGSSDRMDYTVVGATINVGSRLEGLNKVYGTQVLISSPPLAQVGNTFVYRPVDRVLPKGTVHPLDIFELVGVHPDHAAAYPDIAADQHAVAMCARWREVYDYYTRHHWAACEDALAAFRADFGADALSDLYLERVRLFRAEPPPPDWDGVMRYNQK